MNKEIIRQRDRLDDLFRQVSAFAGDSEMQSHWAKYLCVLVSGYLETSVRIILTDYAKNKSSPLIANYVENQISGFQNAKMGKILDLLRTFCPEWAENVKIATEGELKDAVDSIVFNRHKIAHGESITLSYTRVSEYYKKVKDVVDILDCECC